MWPFKKKVVPESEKKLDELMGRIEADLSKIGGFAIIGLAAPSVDGLEALNVAAKTRGISKPKVILAVTRAIGMDPGEVMFALLQFSPSKSLYKSPIQQADLKKS